MDFEPELNTLKHERKSNEMQIMHEQLNIKNTDTILRPECHHIYLVSPYSSEKTTVQIKHFPESMYAKYHIL